MSSAVRVALCTLCSTCVILSASALIPVAQKTTSNSAQQRTLIAPSYSRSLRPLYLANSNANEEDNDDEFEKAVRIAKAKRDIDLILKGPDAPFDVEGELQKVEGISPPLASKEQQLEDQVGELEAELYAAVDQQDYVLASQKKEEIGKMHVDDCGAVLQVNSAFYRAFSEKDYDAMEKLWLKDGSALCIHPSHTPLVGANAVLMNWKKMFDSSNGSFQRSWMIPSGIRLSVKGATAIITCDEEVYCRRFVRGKKRQTELINKLTATNIFRKVDGQWYMVHHHASWHADSEAAKIALKGGATDGTKSTSGGKTILSRRKSDSISGEIAPDGILGNFGPILGAPLPAPQDGPPVKRIIMGGSLSDILNGGLNDLLSSNVSDDQQGDEESSAIIHFHQVNEEGDDDSEDDDDDGEDSDTEAVSIIKQWAKSKDGEDSSVGSSGKTSGANNNAPKDALRQNCITALRKLCNQVRGYMVSLEL